MQAPLAFTVRRKDIVQFGYTTVRKGCRAARTGGTQQMQDKHRHERNMSEPMQTAGLREQWDGDVGVHHVCQGEYRDETSGTNLDGVGAEKAGREEFAWGQSTIVGPFAGRASIGMAHRWRGNAAAQSLKAFSHRSASCCADRSGGRSAM